MLGDVESVNIRLFVPHCADPAPPRLDPLLKPIHFTLGRLMQKLNFPLHVIKNEFRKSKKKSERNSEIQRLDPELKPIHFYAWSTHAKT